jgi:hypothetical protein
MLDIVIPCYLPHTVCSRLNSAEFNVNEPESQIVNGHFCFVKPVIKSKAVVIESYLVDETEYIGG